MNLAKAIGVGALGLMAVSGWTLWNNLMNKKEPPTKEEVLRILETARLQFYPILIKISNLVTKELAPRGMTPEQNEKIVMQDPSIKAEINKINEKIYNQFSEDQVQDAIEKLYREDGDIKHQSSEFRQEFKKSLLGVPPERQITISRKIGKEKVLQSVKTILDDKIDRLATQIGDNFNEGEIRAFLESDVEEDQKVTKEIIKEKLGLIAKDSIKVFQFVVVEYKKDADFKSRYEEILKNYNQKIRKLLPS